MMVQISLFEVKVCFKCGATKPLHGFYRHPRMGDGHLNKCKECTQLDASIRYREKFDNDLEWRERERARGRMKYHQYKYSSQRRSAQTAVGNAVRDGRLHKPDRCSACGAAGHLEGHHPDYEKPLEVKWLCTPCHGKAHRRRAA